MKIAIIGSGIAGLAAGWLLHRIGHQVTLFEKHQQLGMDAHSMLLEGQDSGDSDVWQVRTDVPPRLFNPQLWPNLLALYKAAGVEFRAADPSKSYSVLGENAFLQLDGGYQPSLSALLNSRVRSIAADATVLLKRVRQEVAAGLLDDQQTFGQYLDRASFSNEFVRLFLYPALSSTVCTCDYDALDEYPAGILLNALLNMVDGDGLCQTKYGTQDVVSRLTAPIDDLQLGTEVVRIWQESGTQGDDRRGGQSDKVPGVCAETSTGVQRFDHLIFATQANHVLGLMRDYSQEEAEVLGAFVYKSAPVIVHSDVRLMPPRQADWAHFNLISGDQRDRAMCTVWMNRFNADWQIRTPVFQTIMPIVEPESDSIYAVRRLQRPVVTPDSLVAWERLNRLHDQPNRRIWFCGSYAAYGIPLLESGVVSSLNVVRRIANHLPSQFIDSWATEAAP